MNPDADLINQIASQKLGQAPAPAEGAGPVAAQPPAQNPSTSNIDAPTTDAEKIMAATAAKDGTGDAASEEPMTFVKVKFKDGERDMTPDQIASAMGRYGDLNFKHAQLKPVISLVEGLMSAAKQRGIDANPGDVAKFIHSALMASQKNPTMGNTTGEEPQRPRSAQADEDGNLTDDTLSKWEQDNAVSLPPGYKDLPGKLSQMQQALLQTQKMLQTVLQGNQVVAGQNDQKVQDLHGQLKDERVNAIKQSIGANLQMAQAQFGFPDEAEQDFMNFAMQRGYTLEDFANPDLTMQLASDFKAIQGQPEMERLKAIAAKRQAFTGAGQGAPGAGGAPGAPTGQGADPYFASMVSKHLG